MIQSAFGKVKINKKTYLYVVKMTGNERIYKRVGSVPCKTNVNCDEKLLSLLTANKEIFQGFVSGVDIVLKKN